MDGWYNGDRRLLFSTLLLQSLLVYAIHPKTLVICHYCEPNDCITGERFAGEATITLGRQSIHGTCSVVSVHTLG
jgi:hypothetical protein